MPPLVAIEEEMYRIIEESRRRGVKMRLLGGLAVKVHCPENANQRLHRNYPDIDFVTNRHGGLLLLNLFPQWGYQPNKAFNTLNGDRRQLYNDDANKRHIDIFIGDFEMCHKLPMARRFDLQPITIPLAELFLTKAQIVQINQKDIQDMITLILTHPVDNGDEETINQTVICRLCARDWGLYTTVTTNMERLRRTILSSDGPLDPTQTYLVTQRLDALDCALDSAKKTFLWKMRAKVGKRMRWYEEVEEIQR